MAGAAAAEAGGAGAIGSAAASAAPAELRSSPKQPVSGSAQHTQQQQLSTASSPQPLWEHFVVVGLPPSGLCTVQGEQGFLGTSDGVRYKPALLDALPRTTAAGDERCQLPPQLPTCCLPAGINIVLHQDLPSASLTPRTLACVLTEGDGSKIYAVVLTFYDRMPSDLCARHEDLLGARALKAVCLVSRGAPYLASSEAVLRQLHRIAFEAGSRVPLPDLIHSLLVAVPRPQLGGPQVCLQLGECRCWRVLSPPLPLGPPPGEVPLQPLLEVLGPDSLVGLFAAVLLEQRVLLRSRHHWLLTVVAESVVRLLHPLSYPHVYIPVMPASLADYLEAPTPFLMGLHSSEPVEARVLDLLVVADLDSNGLLTLPRDSKLMQQCLAHPYLQTLLQRVRTLLQPSVTDADVVATSAASGSGNGSDPWVQAARALGAHGPSSPSKQALLLRLFMQFFDEVLSGHQQFLNPGSISEISPPERAASGAGAAAAVSRRDSLRLTSGGGGAGSGAGALSTSGALTSARALRAALSLSGAGCGGGAGAGGGSQQGGGGRPSGTLQLQAQSRVGMQALLDHHQGICQHTSPALLQQVLQGQPFLCFLADAQQQRDWLSRGEAALASWRQAEEQLQQQQSAGGGAAAAPPHGALVVRLPCQAPSPLMPRNGLVHATFPPLILSEASAHSSSPGLRKRRANATSRPSAGRRRAISELMGSPVDLRRKSPQQGTSTDTSPPRMQHMRIRNALDAGQQQQQQHLAQLAPGLALPSLSKISNVSNASTNTSLCEEYSFEAELVRRQTAMLVHLMQAAATAAAAALANSSGSSSRSNSSSGGAAAAAAADQGRGSRGGAAAVLRRYSSSGARSSLSEDVLDAARHLLCIQTGGNGWFIVSRLKELVANPPAPLSEAELRGGTAAASSASTPQAPAARDASGSSAATAAAAAAAAASSPPSPGKKARGMGGVGGGKGGKSGKGSGLAALKVSHGVESFASAASAMASAISRNASMGSRSRQQLNSDHSNSSSPTTSTAPGLPDVPPSAGGAGASTEQQPPCGSSSGALTSAAGSGTAEAAAADPAAAAQAESGGSKKGDITAAGAAGTPPPPTTQQQQGPAGATSAAPSASSSSGAGGSRTVEPCVPPAIFSVLADMLNCVIEAAAAKDDARVALAALELAAVISSSTAAGAGAGAGSTRAPLAPSSCTATGAAPTAPTTRLLLLSALSANPALRAEWFWASTFNFAVSSSYLAATDFVDIRDVVAACLRQFAGFLGGVGIPGAAAWLLLMQLASEHLAHIGPLQPDVLCSLRAHLAATSSSSIQPASDGRPAAHASSGREHGKQQQAAVAAALQACGIMPAALARSSSSGALQAAGGDEDASWAIAPSAAAAGLDGAGSPLASVLSPAATTTTTTTSDAVGLQQLLRRSKDGPPSPGGAAAAAAAAHTHQQRVFCVPPPGLASPLSACASNMSVGYASSSRCTAGSSSPRLGQQQQQHPRLPGVRDAAAGGYATRAGGRPAAGVSSSSSMHAAAGGQQDVACSSEAHPQALRQQGGCLLEPGALQWAAVHRQQVMTLAASSCRAVSVGADGFIKVLDMSAGGRMRLRMSICAPGLAPAAASASPVAKLWHSGRRVGIANAAHHAVWVMDTASCTTTLQLSGLGSAVSSLYPLHRNPDALLAGLATGSKSCRSASPLTAGALLWDLRKPSKPASSLDFDPAAAADAQLHLEHRCCPGGVLCLAVHADGALAAAGLQDGRVMVWDMRKPGTPLNACSGHQGAARHVAFLPAAASASVGLLGRQPLLLSGSDDWTARVFDAETGAPHAVCVGHGGPVTCLQVVHGVASSTRIITGAADGSLGVWGLGGELCSLTQAHDAPLMLLQQGGDTLVSGSDRSCHVWSLLQHQQAVPAAAGSDGSSNGSSLLDGPHGPRLLSTQIKPAAVTAMAFDPVGELLCCGHRDGVVSVWNCCSAGVVE